MRYMLYMCVLRYRVGAYGDGNRLSPNRLDSQVHAHMSRNLRAIEQLAIEVIFYILKGACTSPNGEVRESKHEMKPGANSTGPCGRPHGRHRW
jgi:hypothetical protein